jgi:glyoxylase-like metal-dependent hydrolase (beta-lactamase superfamily II)
MNTLASGLSYVDLNFLGVPRIIATVAVAGPGGVALIDPGPSSTLPALRAALGQAGIAVADLRAILLTHIHLDHAGATGTLVAENRAIKVYTRSAAHGRSREVDRQRDAPATRWTGSGKSRCRDARRPERGSISEGVRD